MGIFDDIQAEAEKYISLPKAFDHIAAAEGSEYKAAMVMAHYIEDFGLLDCCWMATDRRPVWQDTFGNNHSAWDFIQDIKDFYEFPFDEMDPLSKEIRSKYQAFFLRKSDFFGMDIIKRLGLEEPAKDCEPAPSLLPKQSAYDLTEAACLLSGHSPVMVDLCRNDTNFIKNYADYLEAESFIRNAWAVGEINRDNGVFPRADIKKLFERACLHVAGLTEESAPIPASPEPAPQVAEVMPEALSAKASALPAELAAVLDTTHADHAPDLAEAIRLWLALYGGETTKHSHGTGYKHWMKAQGINQNFIDGTAGERIRDISSPHRVWDAQRKERHASRKKQD